MRKKKIVRFTICLCRYNNNRRVVKYYTKEKNGLGYMRVSLIMIVDSVDIMIMLIDIVG